MAVLHSFFDESGKFHDHKVVAFCGFGASTSQLKEFDERWENQLRRTGMDALHMVKAHRYSEALGRKIGPQTLRERIKELKPFADCINEYLGLGVACVFEVSGYTAFPLRSKEIMGGSENPFYTQFLRTMVLLLSYAKSEEHITVMCDEDEETSWNCYSLLRRVKKINSEAKRKFSALIFADDKHFPALQAADMLSFLCRKEANYRFFGIPYEFRPLFLYLTAPRGASSLEWRGVFKDKAALRKLGVAIARSTPKRKKKLTKK